MPVSIQYFSTSTVPPQRRLKYWNQVAATVSTGLSIDSGNLEFNGHLQSWQLGEVTVFRANAEPSVVHRAPVHSGEERLLIHLMTRGVCEQRQRGCETLLRPGDFSVCTRTSAARLATNAHEMLVMEVARHALESRVADVDRHLGCPTPGTSPAAHSFAQFITALWREAAIASGPRDPAWEDDASTILLDLLGLALRSTKRGVSSCDTQVQARLKSIIETRIGDPGLNVVLIADELGVSVRSVQNWFSSMQTTARHYILRRRLERAAELLATDPAINITTLAIDLGFNDPAYFARSFRSAFGLTPSAMRRNDRAGGTA